MIVFLLTGSNADTLEKVIASADCRVATLSYKKLFAQHPLPKATYIFTDLDRLSNWMQRLAACAYRQIRAQGATVLNDPARLTSRYGLLRKLHAAGINHFNAYRVEDNVQPNRWPVFLRTEGDHTGPLTDLLHDWKQTQSAIEQAIAVGIPQTSLLIVEYAAEEILPGLFRRMSIYRLGDARIADTCVHNPNWRAKIGADGLATPQLYEEELRIVRENPYREVVDQAFAIAGVEYGRADFSLVNGGVQIYEINTNPTVELLGDSPSPYRSESRRLCNTNYLAALKRLDTPDSAELLQPFDPVRVPKAAG